MRRNVIFALAVSGLFIFLCDNVCFAAPTATSELASEERKSILEERDAKLRQKVEDKRTSEPAPDLLPAQPKIESQQKITPKKIEVTGVSLIPMKDIEPIVKPLENKEITIQDLQKAADKITDIYRQRGYITSRAYLPPQKISEGLVEVRVLEGAMGDVEIRGNRYFRTNLLRNKISLKKGEAFNYNKLRKDLIKINEAPDRFCKTVLAPGKVPGTTDLTLEVKDNLPIHVGFDWDNFGSRYINKNRYSARFTHNNLLGFDDKLTFQYQLAEAGSYYLKNVRYLAPVGRGLEVGGYAYMSKVKLGKEYKETDVRGKSQLYGAFANRSLIDGENFDMNLNLGFDYKNVVNYQSGAVTSHDRLRVAKAGFDMDLSDKLGRTILTYELDCGIPDIMGGLAAKDINASRTGAGGKFVKNGINLLRLHKMPFSSTLLWKNQIQISPYNLPSTEQIQLGGITNVRGYPSAEAVGDQGYTMTFEWSCPVYGIPKNFIVPFTKTKMYDALRIVTFYDWGNVHLRTPATSEEKNKTLRSIGCGMRFNLPKSLSMRVEVAWPLDNLPSDGNRVRTWAQVTKDF
ncbi:MAG: ShlB/FhaC/HecB family hemolysin secretion/activation protein [Candidatus Omnitrophota bacterium]